MDYTAIDALGCLAAGMCFATFLLAPGLLLALFGGVLDRPAPLRLQTLLWSVALSLPAALLLVNVAGRVVPEAGLLACFGAMDVAALFWLVRGRKRWAVSAGSNRSTRRIVLAMAALIGYVVVMTSSIQTGAHHLYESVNASDLSVRIPLVRSAIWGGIPPGNPMFAVAGHAQPMRYYFYWYTLCAQVGRLTGLPARACFSGSVLWAGFGLIAALFLYRRSLGPPAKDLRRQYVVLLGLCCVMSIDIVPAVAGLFLHPARLMPEVEWWRNDRAPSFLGAIIFAPHHIGGIVCAAVGLLCLVLVRLRPAGEAENPPASAFARSAVVAGICFAATAGTSTYVMLCFAFMCVVYGLNLIRRRDWPSLAALVGAGLLAVALSGTFLHEMLSRPALDTPTTGTETRHFFKITVRNAYDSIRIARYALRAGAHVTIASRSRGRLLGSPLVIPMTLLEFGFLMFPLGVQLWRDVKEFRSTGSLPLREQVLLCAMLGILVPMLFLSSEPTQGVNDLGRHAGLIARFLVVVWSTPVVAEYWGRWRKREPVAPGHPWLLRSAVVFLIVGLASQIWQLLQDRSFLMIAERGHIPIQMPFVPDSDLAARYMDVRRGFDLLARRLPARSLVQSNPGSRFEPLAMLYSPFQFAAADSGCEAAFGGSTTLCKPVVADLQALFGGPNDSAFEWGNPPHTIVAPDAEQTATVAQFRGVCEREHLAALLAFDSDPAWQFPHSWVWQPAFYATDRVRIIPCPAPPPN